MITVRRTIGPPRYGIQIGPWFFGLAKLPRRPTKVEGDRA